METDPTFLHSAYLSSTGGTGDVGPNSFSLYVVTATSDNRQQRAASTWFGRGMLARGSGCIISIASLASFRGFARNGIYCMSKHSVVAMTETLASEWAGRGVRVNAIAPGFFMTDLNKDSMTDDRKQRAMSRIPMGRFGDLDELAGAAVYLASPGAKYVTGETIRVDGGFLAAGM